MRKRIKPLLVFTLVLFLSFISKVSASQEVELYLFKGEGCPHCEKVEELIKELKEDYNYSEKFNATIYEVWYDEANKELMEKVAEKLNTEVKGVPFIVIGNTYYSGFNDEIGEKIKLKISSEYNNPSYEDIVDPIANPFKYENDDNDYDYNYNLDDFYNYLDDYGENVSNQVGMVFGSVFITFLLIFIFFVLIVGIYKIFVFWKVFKKAGRNGWEAIIPFYNSWVLFEISGYPGAYIFFGFIPFVGTIILFVFQILAAISLAKKFKKEGGFHVLLWLLPVIGYSILAFGDAKYDRSLGEQRNKTNNNTSTNNETYEQKSTVSKNENNFCGNCGCRVSKDSKHCTNCGKKIN